jgi:hypothetical protein
MTRIENHKYSIEETFSECFYIVPDYQHEDVWPDKEVQQLYNVVNQLTPKQIPTQSKP